MATFKLIMLAAVLLALAFAGIAIKIIFKKNGEFAGTCASKNPMLNKEGEPCSFCGALPEEKCKNEDN
ncbi:MAG: hypothetical protein RLZZ414_214 [Bacteroidota bacterium]|jgi:hypothetical protein